MFQNKIVVMSSDMSDQYGLIGLIAHFLSAHTVRNRGSTIPFEVAFHHLREDLFLPLHLSHTP